MRKAKRMARSGVSQNAGRVFMLAACAPIAVLSSESSSVWLLTVRTERNRLPTSPFSGFGKVPNCRRAFLLGAIARVFLIRGHRKLQTTVSALWACTPAHAA